MREDVGVALQGHPRRERPSVQRLGPGVVVVDERDGLSRSQADQAGRPPLGVLHTEQLAQVERGLEDALGGVIERGGGAADGVHPVREDLPVRVLVGERLAVCAVRQVGPYLRHREVGRGGVEVRAGDGRGVAEGEVEAPAVEADVIAPQPVEPVRELAPDARVEVVEVRRRLVVQARVGVARAVGVAVVAADHAGAPVQTAVRRAALEDAVHAARVLALRRAVVEDDVGDALDALTVERRDEGPQLRLVPVPRHVQVVQPPRKITCRCDGGGSHTWVIPAAAMSSTWLLRELYHPDPVSFHDSQLKAYQRMDGRSEFSYQAIIKLDKQEDKGKLSLPLPPPDEIASLPGPPPTKGKERKKRLTLWLGIEHE
ncbi:hypothetical protein U9M48_009691 [Paspalum notatum var. saurae]|uniref:Uncharacterized protein n=1 Tax=Paspalum notatum var. saurae TaxID=547442 RepID=A0AAQ3SS45_PASNO